MFYRKQLGDMVRVAAQVQPGATATSGPTITVNDASGAVVETMTMPGWPIRMDEDERFLGNFFADFFFLDGKYSVGNYSITVHAVLSTGNYGKTHQLQILPGGNSKGAVIASHYNDLPEAHGVIYQRNDGTLERLSNPR